MKIVGVGAGPNLLTGEAISAIENATVIFGSKRAIELAKEHIRCKTWEITDYTLDSLPKEAVVLSTGDPMLSGLGKFARTGDEVIPGISSMQIACSRLHLDISSISIITAHSRDLNAAKKRLVTGLRSGKKVFFIPDPAFGVNELAGLLKSECLTRNISVCERLAYTDERIVTGSTEKPPAAESDLYCIVISS
ncbi:MAG: cobalt-precorrin-7 (C(5))-methyltransferase [Candidatus Methanoperedens sp.]|nr:cobalt-precorrin-7 (C(5))-methyltransferase [Candidatus Methanoperedens sp.]